MSETSDFLFEIGTEEIPAGYLAKAMESITARLQTIFKDYRLDVGDSGCVGTPRRLVIRVSDVEDRQANVEEEMVGPPARVAFDSDGQPTKAAVGFAKRNGVEIDALRQGTVEGKKGEYLLCTRREAGKSAEEILPEIMLDIIQGIPWPKSMRWHGGETVFVRPVHWMMCVLGEKILEFSYAGIRSGRETFGHRFLAPGPIEIFNASYASYCSMLKDAFVIVDPDARGRMVREEIVRLEEEVGAKVRKDLELVEEVANLVEFPFGICGEFSKNFLKIPHRAIVSAMRSHQRYFAMEDADGQLLNRFITIAGTKTKDIGVVRKGNQRVLAARLADAQFFYQEDNKTNLDELAEKLDRVVFQKKLGSIADKVERMGKGAERLANEFGVAEKVVARSVALCKADLCSHMVGEFPDLQGTMGRHYAQAMGESEEVCTALEEHYMPKGAKDALPVSDAGAIVSIADRMDTIAGCFAIGVVPTGSADPFGLRRAALGVLRIFSEREWRVNLEGIVLAATEVVVQQCGLKADIQKVVQEILSFLKVRYRGYLSDGEVLPSDCVDAALVIGFLDPRDAKLRAEAVAKLRNRPGFDPFAAAFKRVANILKGQTSIGIPDPSLFVETQEKELWASYEEIRERVDGCLVDRDYVGCLEILSELKKPVDSFFDDVKVMDDDIKIRNNRLAILGTINAAFTQIADFRQLAV